MLCQYSRLSEGSVTQSAFIGSLTCCNNIPYVIIPVFHIINILYVHRVVLIQINLKLEVSLRKGEVDALQK